MSLDRTALPAVAGVVAGLTAHMAAKALEASTDSWTEEPLRLEEIAEACGMLEGIGLEIAEEAPAAMALIDAGVGAPALLMATAASLGLAVASMCALACGGADVDEAWLRERIALNMAAAALTAGAARAAMGGAGPTAH